MASKLNQKEETVYIVEEEIEGEEDDGDEEPEDWDDWRGDDEDGNLESDFLCLFCDSKYDSCGSLFEHCTAAHHFDFHGIRKALSLDFYDSFKLINYIRSQVAENKCWNCGLTCQSNKDLQNHLHEIMNLKDIKDLWDDERYLKPCKQDDSLLYNFGEFEEAEDEQNTPFDREEILRDLKNSVEIQNVVEKEAVNDDICDDNGLNQASSSDKEHNDGKESRFDKDLEERHLMSNSRNLVASHIKKVNESYFGSYSAFGIHREMLSDKVRMDAYGQAILKNPSLLNDAVVMDVGCGTGILSLFAAQGGAARVIAVEASAKMVSVASQIAKDNGLLWSKSQIEGDGFRKGVIEVVHGMVEVIDKNVEIQPHSIDVLLSEWMGYCLLYESMLSSVLYARDQWLKPGGAILPDTATIFVAGFGKGGTSLPFWEEVCGFDMSSVGKELVKDAAHFPIVDVVDHQDVVTTTAILQTFDLATMKPNQVDFTATATLEPKLGVKENNVTQVDSKMCCWCYGVVLWFETGFTSRFCQETPAVLSTSPYAPKTHWSQTILTFREPIALGFYSGQHSAIGTDICPATKIDLRISIVRSTVYRSIDISLEAAAVDRCGQKRNWPVQLFSLH